MWGSTRVAPWLTCYPHNPALASHISQLKLYPSNHSQYVSKQQHFSSMQEIIFQQQALYTGKHVNFSRFLSQASSHGIIIFVLSQQYSDLQIWPLWERKKVEAQCSQCLIALLSLCTNCINVTLLKLYKIPMNIGGSWSSICYCTWKWGSWKRYFSMKTHLNPQDLDFCLTMLKEEI